MASFKLMQMVVLLLLAGAVVIHVEGAERRPIGVVSGKAARFFGVEASPSPSPSPRPSPSGPRGGVALPGLTGVGVTRPRRALQAAVQEAYDSGVSTGRYLASLDPKAEGWFHSGVEDGRALLSQELEAAAAADEYEYDYEDSTIDEHSY